MLFFNRRKRYFFEYEDDIHAHVLPGLDDGVKTMDEAVMIVKRMERMGLKRLTCTPHVAYPAMINTPKDVESMLFVLKLRLQEEGVRVEVDSGAEYRMGEFMLELLERGKSWHRTGEKCWLSIVLSGLPITWMIYYSVYRDEDFVLCWRIRNGIRFTRRILSGIVSGLKKKVERCR